MTEKRPYDVRVTIDAVTWATSPEEAARLTEEELRDSGFTPTEDSASTVAGAPVEGRRCGACGQPALGAAARLLLEAIARHLRLSEQEDLAAAGDRVGVELTWSEEYEQVLLEKALPGASDTVQPRVFQAEIPAALWAAFSAAEQAQRAAHRRILELVGFDEEMGRLAEPCPRWVGDVHPGHSSWAIFLEPAADGWPQREARLGWRSSRAEAASFIESLPDQFLVLSPHGDGLVLVRRERLRLQEEGMRSWPSRCHRCGWERDAHPEAIEAAPLPTGTGR